MDSMTSPGLYGLQKTNRDFTQRDAWGKNNFNSAFPAALCCYMASKGIDLVYLKTDGVGGVACSELSVADVFGMPPASVDIYYAFEAQYSPYQKFVVNELPRVDLVVQDLRNGSSCKSGLEVKLTALPDESTFALADDSFGCELVVRPDSIVYLACSIANAVGLPWLRENLPDLRIKNWADPSEVVVQIAAILEFIKKVAVSLHQKQSPFLLQPIWKTQGSLKSQVQHPDAPR